MRRFAFSGDVACLEIARGHDGFLRGNPEPVVIFATYLVSGGDAHVVGRSLHRFRANSPFPSAAAADQTALPSCCADLGEAVGPAWTVLALGLEEDGGRRHVPLRVMDRRCLLAHPRTGGRAPLQVPAPVLGRGPQERLDAHRRHLVVTIPRRAVPAALF